jgi:peptidoglycan/LPS O-acetylase OafA/YrhL
LGVFGVHFNQVVELQGQAGPFDVNRLLTNGNTGVALFFVLSGFLLSIPYWRAQFTRDDHVDLKTYTIRRLARILPAYYLCLLIILAAKAYAGHSPDWSNILSHALFTFNLRDGHILSLNPPFWTLAVEMQFYVLLPLVFYGLRTLSPSTAFGVVIIVCLGSYLANYAMMSHLIARDQWPVTLSLAGPFAVQISGANSLVLTYSTLAHLTYFFIGTATAWLFLRTRDDRGEASRALGQIPDLIFWTSGAAVLLIISTPLDDVLQVPFGRYNWPIVPVLLAATVITGPSAKSATAFFGWSPIRWFGIISYGIYIYHYPLQRVTAMVLGAGGLDVKQHWLLFGVLSLAATILVAAASYAVVERPIMRAARGKHSARGPLQAHGKTSQDVERAQVVMSLRLDQLSYLRHLSEQRGTSLSGAARYVISRFMKDLERSSPPGDEPAQAFPVLDSSGPSGHRRAHDDNDNREYQQVVSLRTEQVEFLRTLSTRLGADMSRTAQMILDEFMKDTTVGQKRGT